MLVEAPVLQICRADPLPALERLEGSGQQNVWVTESPVCLTTASETSDRSELGKEAGALACLEMAMRPSRTEPFSTAGALGKICEVGTAACAELAPESESWA